MKERPHKDVFGRARLDAMLRAQHQGKTSNEELAQAARIAEQRAIERMGVESEKRFDRYAAEMPITVTIRNASPHEDVYRKIDKWITLESGLGLPELPVQVKSSYRDVKLFKYGDPDSGKGPDIGFTNLNGIEIVVNCGRAVSPKAFKTQMRDEIRRITLTLRGNPSLADALKK